MKTSKLVVGILMIVLSVFITIQSSVAGLGNALSQNGQASGSAGIITAIMYLVAGIVYLVTRNKTNLGGDIASMVLLIIAGIMGLANAGSYSDLVVWAVLAFIIGIGFFVWHLLLNKKETKSTNK